MNPGLRCALTVGAVALLPLRGILASPYTAGAALSRATRTVPLEVTVQGTVTDTAGTPLANVQVVANGVNRAALTDERGRFVFRGLPAGTYHLDFVRIGFSSAHQVVTVPASGPEITVTVIMRVATVRLSSVNVTATPTGTDPLNVTQATVQLSGKELQRALSTSLGQTLAKEPGMATRFNGPMAATPVIRGLTGERVLVLQDGDRAGDLSSAAADHLNAVDPSTAERIEVIRGPASLLYGNNALGGVVNVISQDIPTTIPTRVTGYSLVQGESVTPGGVVNIGLTLPVSSTLAVTLRGGLRQFANMRVGGGAAQPNTNGNTQQFVLGSGYVGSRASVGVVFREMDFAYGLPHAAEDEAVRLDGVRRSLVLQSTLNTGWGALPSVRVDQTVQRYSHAEIEEDGAVGTRFRLNTQTTNITARTQWGRATGAVGAQGLFRQYAPVGDEAFTPAADNENVALFAYQELPLGLGRTEEHSPRLQLGARYDRFSIHTKPGLEAARFGEARTRTFDNVAASLGLSVPVAEGVSLTANGSRGFRAPAVEELYAQGFHAAVGTFDIGNPDLAAEKSTGLEVGLRAQTPRVFAQFGAYRNMIDDYVVPELMAFPALSTAPGVPVVTFVGRDALMHGVEGQIESKLVYRFVGGVMGDYVRATIRGTDESLPFIPAGRLGASLRYDSGRVSAGGDVRRVFAQSRVSGGEFDVPTDAYTMLDLNATWLFTVHGKQVHSMTFRVDNALDEQYRDATSRIKRFAFNPGRNAALVYKLLF
ncbi:TonB-dependent receptor [Gemmatimonas sp.]|uniref:TonB-dependent receptor n=1 Tax=Gemmatimonas sp. TaxID=1962908 RepID=UPI003DA33FE8